jgi:predicted O-methyltransferase YrrM
MIDSERSDALDHYVEGLFAREDALLRELRAQISRQQIPAIYISPEVGRLLQVLLRAIGARRVLEIGTLGGYSAIWMARALPPGGRLLSLEVDPERAAFARDFAVRADLDDVIEVRVGDARTIMEELVHAGAGPFDAVFIDADKESYVEYLDRSLELVRPGGLILADNAFRSGRVLDDDPDESVSAVIEYNRRIATDARLHSTILPVRDGVAVSVVGAVRDTS